MRHTGGAAKVSRVLTTGCQSKSVPDLQAETAPPRQTSSRVSHLTAHKLKEASAGRCKPAPVRGTVRQLERWLNWIRHRAVTP